MSASSPIDVAYAPIDPLKDSSRLVKLHARLQKGTLAAVVLFVVPFAFMRIGPLIMSGLTQEKANYGSIAFFLICWPLCVYCCLSGIVCGITLVCRRSGQLVSMMAVLLCGALLWLMQHLIH